MQNSFVKKFKESSSSVIPVMLVVVVLHFILAPMGTTHFLQFLVGGALLIMGLSIFLLGAEIGMVPFGQRLGSSLTRKRNMFILLPAAFVIGFAVTIAEPDVQVLADQVSAITPAIDRQTLLIMIAIGVGFFLIAGMVRAVLQLSLRLLLIIFYMLVFALCLFVERPFVSVAFDAGGATTGPVTVPFIMALGIGVASAFKRKKGDDSSFGLVGLASIGPIAAVAVMGFFNKGGLRQQNFNIDETSGITSLWAQFSNIVPDIVHEMSMALSPLLLIFVFFQITTLKLPARQMRRILLGLLYTFIGLVIFMTGVEGGFSPAGHILGKALGGLWNGHALIPIGMVLGAVVVCAEPAVWVLTEQVEEVSGGYIRRPIMLAALCVSIAMAVGLGMVRVVTGLDIFWIIVPGYGLALLLSKFCPPLFTAIAFDSGGVASGPMATTFVLSLTVGSSIARGGNPLTDAFGMIAMIAMAPLVTIQLLGLIFKHKEKREKRHAGKG